MTKFERISIHIKSLIDTYKSLNIQSDFSKGVLACLHELNNECELLELGKNLFDYNTMKKELEEKKNDYSNKTT